MGTKRPCGNVEKLNFFIPFLPDSPTKFVAEINEVRPKLLHLYELYMYLQHTNQHNQSQKYWEEQQIVTFWLRQELRESQFSRALNLHQYG